MCANVPAAKKLIEVVLLSTWYLHRQELDHQPEDNNGDNVNLHEFIDDARLHQHLAQQLHLGNVAKDAEDFALELSDQFGSVDANLTLQV